MNSEPELWGVIPHPSKPGFFLGRGINRYGQEFIIEGQNEDHLRDTLLQMQLPDGAEALFLDAWKRGVKLAGEAWFEVTVASVDAATHVNQLRPDWERMPVAMRTGTWAERQFIACLFSFYNDDRVDEIQRAQRARRYPFGRLAIRIDSDRRAVLADLLDSYRGW